jgi:hypothetical protein
MFVTQLLILDSGKFALIVSQIPNETFISANNLKRFKRLKPFKRLHRAKLRCSSVTVKL